MDRDTYPTQEYLRIGEAARKIGVSVDTLRRWDREGKLPSRRLPSGQRLYDSAQVDEFIAAGAA